MKLKNKISVVIATYNGEKYIKKELDSIQNQTLTVDEVIIGDDGSIDNTVSIVDNYIKTNKLDTWKLIVNEKNLGLAKNFFHLLSLASGDYIFIADQDDEWLNDKVEKMIEIMSNNQDIMCLTSSFDIIDKNSKIIEPPKGLTNVSIVDDGSLVEINTRQLIGHSMLRGCMMCVKKELINTILETKIPDDLSMDLLCHDWAISIIATIKGKCMQLNKILTHYRVHDSNTSLENLDRLHMKRKIERRINGLEKSIESHRDLLKYELISANLSREDFIQIEKQIEFEQKRLRYLKEPNFVNYIKLVIRANKYSCYYHSFYQGLKVLLGDFIYVIENKRG